MPVAARTQAERAAELERVCLVEGQLAAYKAEIVAAMELSVKRLRALVARELISRDAAAAERRRNQAERTPDVTDPRGWATACPN